MKKLAALMSSKSAPFRLALLAAGVALCLAPSAGRGQTTNRPPLAPASAAPLPAKARAAALAIQRQSWEQGVLAVAFLEEGDDEMVVQMARASLIHLSRDGVPAASGGAPSDPLMAGEAILRAARLTGDLALGKAVTNMLDYALKTAPRAADGTLFHTGQQIWSDSFHTSPPFLAAAGRYDEAILQIEGHRKRLWNPEKKLVAHIWDERGQRFQDGSFWGGGQGWAAAGLARVIRALPENRSADKARLAGYLKDLIDGCLAHQSPGGLFYNVVDDPRSFEETDLAQMLAYSIYESVRGGWLPRDYLAAADRMRSAARAKVDADGFVQGVCGAPNFSRPGISAEGQAFFLMMEASAAKLTPGTPR
jgi:rhamnogalacturonyl hydrolase YesR